MKFKAGDIIQERYSNTDEPPCRIVLYVGLDLYLIGYTQGSFQRLDLKWVEIYFKKYGT